MRLGWRALAVVVAAAVWWSCAAWPPTGRSIRVVGSDTMLALMLRLAVGFMGSHPGTSVVVEGGGTGVGFEALIAGRADLAAASGALAADEARRLFERHGVLGVRVVVAQDALSVWVHPDNPVRELSTRALRDLFSGAVDSWAAVGGEPVEVVPVIRLPSSGTARFFRNHVLFGGEYAASAVTAPTTPAVVAAVASDRRAIGYGGIAYYEPGVAAVALDGVRPELDAIRSGLYPLTRFLQLYSVAAPDGPAREFVDYCLSPAGQRLVSEVGYIPSWER